MQHVQLQGHSKAEHASIVMSFYPHCMSLPLWSVVGSGGVIIHAVITGPPGMMVVRDKSDY